MTRVTLTQERLGEIAWESAKYVLRKKGIRSLAPNDVWREIGNVKEFLKNASGISPEEAKEFKKRLYKEVLAEVDVALG